MDIGVSSYQIDEDSRGFSYMHDAVLDMRMDQTNPVSAKDIVNTYSQEDLENIIFKYSEEKWAKRIAQFICNEREIKPINTTFELVEVIEKAIPKKVRMNQICKDIFKQRQKGCICPPEIPVCVCNHKPEIKIITRKPIEPSPEELKQNSRARSAKLRVAEKII